MVKIGIVGGTGYTGVELLRLLSRHPQAKLMAITSRKEAGMPVSEMFPSLRRVVDLKFSTPDEADLNSCDVVFFATPHGVAMNMGPELVNAGVKIIDLAADFRLKDPKMFEQWYKMPHTALNLLEEAVYGLPELNRERLKKARVVGMPGCYPTTVQLGLKPLLENKLIDATHIISDSKSGVSGAGRKGEINLLFSEAADNFMSYGVKGHRHHPEIVQELSRLAGSQVGLIFSPHLTPMIRGMQSTIYARITKEADFQKLYEETYAGEPFVDVMPPGSAPDTRSVRGANTCRLAIHRPHNGDTLMILSVIDNLTKGAAGQAVQAMNLACGLPETMGLEGVGLVP
ncbi:MAG TPA: N-acetyl-gamma-glutamyl-phosphate reductase [Burkholderiales bacterium]|jgi:N-acetyl-gamma-glutamyl-phosphate reductase